MFKIGKMRYCFYSKKFQVMKDISVEGSGHLDFIAWDYPYNPIKFIKQRIEAWHNDWAMERLAKVNKK